MNEERMLVDQVSNFNTYCDRLERIFLQLSIKRIQTDDMTRDEYMMYDMLDSLIHLISALDEVVGKEEPYPAYVLEKMNKVKSYIDTTCIYWNERVKSSTNE